MTSKSSNTQFSPKNYYTMDKIYKHFFNVPNLNKKIALLSQKSLRKIKIKIFQPFFIFTYNEQWNDFPKDIMTLFMLSTNPNLYIYFVSRSLDIAVIRNLSPVQLFYNLYKLRRIKYSKKFKYEGQKNIIKQLKKKIKSQIAYEFNHLLMIYEDEIFLKRKMLNEILLQTEKNEDLFKMQKKVIKEQMQEFQTYQQRININTDHNINKFINLYLSNSQFQWSWISYNTLIAQEKIKIFHKFPWIKFLYNLCFDFNITFNQFVKLSEETNSFASFLNDKKMILNFSLNLDNLLNLMDKGIQNFNKNNEKIVNTVELNINKNKDLLRKKNHNRYLKNHESIKKYRKESLVLMESYEKYFIEKYGNNLYNKRSYYEFLITKSNMMSNYIKSQQKIIEYQWSMALKNPFTKIKLY